MKSFLSYIGSKVILLNILQNVTIYFALHISLHISSLQFAIFGSARKVVYKLLLDTEMNDAVVPCILCSNHFV